MSIYENLSANIILNGKRLDYFHLHLGKKIRRFTITTFIQHFTGGPSLYGKARKETKDMQIGKEELQVITIIINNNKENYYS